jgi:hypothetical protein
MNAIKFVVLLSFSVARKGHWSSVQMFENRDDLVEACEFHNQHKGSILMAEYETRKGPPTEYIVSECRKVNGLTVVVTKEIK